jgi:hypothetical protein
MMGYFLKRKKNYQKCWGSERVLLLIMSSKEKQKRKQNSTSEQNYFLVTEVDKWSIKAAFKEIEDNDPVYTTREILHKLKSNIKEVTDKNDGNRAQAAKKILDDWKVNKSIKYFISKVPM